MKKMLIVIDNEVVEIEEIHANGFGGYLIECNNGCEYQVFASHEDAGEAAREYWADMAKNDPKELTCLVGEETLVKWALNQYAGPGNEQVRNLDEWLDLTADYPEEHWASYDGNEIEGAKFNKNFENETGYDNRNDIVLYRCN